LRIALCFALSAVALCAQQPGTIKEFPVFPGAVRQQPAKAGQDGVSRPLAQEISRELVEYKTAASAEEVYAWYRQKLKAKGMEAPVTLDEEGRLPIRCVIAPYEAADFQDSARVMSDDNYEGAWIRDQLKARRKAVDGSYVKLGSFVWSFIDDKERPHNLSVNVEDRTFFVYRGDAPSPDGKSAVGKKDYRQSTVIRFMATVTMSPADMGVEEGSEDDS